MRSPNLRRIQLISGEHLATEVMRQEQERNHDAGQQVAEDNLKEAPGCLRTPVRGVPTIVKVLVSADTIEGRWPTRARPVRPASSSRRLFWPRRKRAPNQGDAGKVGENDRQIEVRHENSDFQHSVDLL